MVFWTSFVQAAGGMLMSMRSIVGEDTPGPRLGAAAAGIAFFLTKTRFSFDRGPARSYISRNLNPRNGGLFNAGI